MQHSNTAIDAPKGKSNMVILLLIGLIGVAGLVYVMNASSGDASFSENEVLTTTSISMVE